MKKFIALLILLMVTCSPILFGAELTYKRNIGSASHRDLTAEEFDGKSIAYQNENYIMTDIDVYETPGGLRYSMLLQENTDNRAWMQYKAILEYEFENLVKFLKLQNFRLTDWEVYMVNGNPRYAAIFVKNLENYEWEFRFDQSKSSFVNYARLKSLRGFNIIDLEVRTTNSGLRFASVWVKYAVKIRSKMYFAEPYEQFQQRIKQLQEQGWLMVNYEPYEEGNAKKYAVILHKQIDYSGIAHNNLTDLQFANGLRLYADMGYRLVDFECLKTSDGLRYAGVWIECDNRFNFSDKEAMDQVIKQYRYDNDLPGISVAIIKNGEMLYRRGFGFADVDNGKIAHGETVYLAASVSKVIGGTLAVKLQNEGRLRDGQIVNLNLNNTTGSYLTNVRKSDNSLVTLSAEHTHTLAQLYAHLGCLKHYDGVSPSIRQYDKAIDALTQIWDPNRALLSNCIANTGESHYSTHAHTYLAAVLENITGKSAARLVRSEIAVPYGLKTMRAQFTTRNLLPDYNRAIPYIRVGGYESEGEPGYVYRYHNKAISYENNSWKVFGGGIEVSTVDLAYFGWKVLDGQIVNANARDNTLWRKVNSGVDCNPCDYGIGWFVSNPGPNLVAQHGGTYDGARALIKIYKGEGLVIAIMSNRNDHKVRDIGELAIAIKSLL